MQLRVKLKKYFGLLMLSFVLTLTLSFKSFAGEWRLENNSWKFYNDNNEAISGWIFYNNSWYLLDENTKSIKLSWYKNNKGQWYFFQIDKKALQGAMLTGWQWIDGYCYYFDVRKGADEGVLFVSAKTPDGYQVNDKGQWIDSNSAPVYIAGKGILTKSTFVSGVNNGEKVANRGGSSGGGSSRGGSSGGGSSRGGSSGGGSSRGSSSGGGSSVYNPPVHTGGGGSNAAGAGSSSDSSADNSFLNGTATGNESGSVSTGNGANGETDNSSSNGDSSSDTGSSTGGATDSGQGNAGGTGDGSTGDTNSDVNNGNSDGADTGGGAGSDSSSGDNTNGGGTNGEAGDDSSNEDSSSDTGSSTGGATDSGQGNAGGTGDGSTGDTNSDVNNGNSDGADTGGGAGSDSSSGDNTNGGGTNGEAGDDSSNEDNSSDTGSSTGGATDSGQGNAGGTGDGSTGDTNSGVNNGNSDGVNAGDSSSSGENTGSGADSSASNGAGANTGEGSSASNDDSSSTTGSDNTPNADSGTVSGNDSNQSTPNKEELTEKKVELKNVESAYLYKIDANNEFVKVLSIDEVDSDLSKYKVKAYLGDANKFIWLDVNSIALNGDKYKVDTSLDELISVKEDGGIVNGYSIEVEKRKEETQDEYTSFSSMINGMKAKSNNSIISGTFIVAEDLTASELPVEDNQKSYLDNYTFSGTLKSKSGKNFSIVDLKRPLFNHLLGANILNLNLKDVDILVSRFDEVGSLTNSSTGSTIRNISANGNIIGNNHVGGLIGILDGASNLENSYFKGKISSTGSAGGLVSNITRGSSVKNSFADIYISITAETDDSIGGIAAQINQDGSIENSYVKGNIYNNGDAYAKVGGAVGAVYTVGEDSGKISNVVSFVKVVNGQDFIGNLKELKVSNQKEITNNYLVNNISSGKHEQHQGLSYIDEADAILKSSSLYTPVEISLINKNSSKVSYKNLKEYKQSYDLAYENIAKLLPFYDRFTIVREGNKLSENDNLNTKSIASIQILVDDKIVNDLYSNKNRINKLLVLYKDGTKEEFEISNPTEFKNTGIIDYTLNEKGINYHPNRLAKDNSSFIRRITEDMKNLSFDYTLFNPYNLADWDDKGRIHRLGRLYLEDNLNKVKSEVEDLVLGLVDNSDIGDYTKGRLNTYMVNKLSNNKKSLLVGLDYLDRWYNFSNARDTLLYSLDVYGQEKNSLDLVINMGSETINVLASDNTDRAYGQVISNYTGISDISDFVKEIYIRNKDDENIDTWIKNNTKAYIVVTKSKVKEDINEGIFERFSKIRYKQMILPLMTVKEENVYAILTSNSSNFGIFDPYMDNIDKNNNKYMEQLAKVKDRIDGASLSIQSYFDTLYRILDASSVDKLISTKIQVFDAYKNSREIWSDEYGSGALEAVKAFAGPIKRWVEYKKDASAYAINVFATETVHYVKGKLLTQTGLSTLTHEHVHNLDDLVLLKGYLRRFGHGPESYARGLLQSPTQGTDTLGLNLIFETNKSDEYLLTHNSSPERFQNTDDLKEYMKGVFDVLYTLDLAEAEVLLEKGKYFIQNNYKHLGSDNEYENNRLDVISNLGNISNMSGINDLVDASIIGPDVNNGIYGNNDYISINMFNAQYGINENTIGASGGFTLRRVAFELLAEKGYYEGMLPYISNKFYFEAGEEEKDISKSDTYILKKIFDNKYSDFKEFRKDMFAKREAKKNDLKSIQTWGVGNLRYETINSYEDIKRLIRAAINTGNKYTVSSLKRNIYHAYLLRTREFRESIYKNP